MRAPSVRSTTARSACDPAVTRVAAPDSVGSDLAASAVARPASSTGSLAAVTEAVGARRVWTRVDASGRAVTGAGVGVAVLDSGVNPVRGLDAPGKLVPGPDLTPESLDDATTGRDTAGHGTHLAGIVAACDAGPRDARTGAPVRLGASAQYGVAPDARLFTPKLATARSETDVASVIETLNWLSEHASDPGVGVRVVLLALGTEVRGGGRMDALTAAARRAWRSGLTVVVSAGNDGNDAPLTNPAIDPYVLAVGSSAPTDGSWASPTVSPFSNGGTAERHTDVLAPGASVESLRNPGSTADREHPEGLVPGDATGRLFRGSGTSQAAAVVAGAAALLLQANPELTPDQVKAALMLTARPLAGVEARLQGAGQIDVAAAVELATSLPSPAEPGRHSVIDDSYLNVPVGDVPSGAHSTALGWNALRWNALRWNALRWNALRWNALRWNALRWNALRWNALRWNALRWNALRWNALRWNALRWNALRWNALRWNALRWNALRWNALRWNALRWNALRWNALRWN